jgi:hypothetical protein
VFVTAVPITIIIKLFARGVFLKEQDLWRTHFPSCYKGSREIGPDNWKKAAGKSGRITPVIKLRAADP